MITAAWNAALAVVELFYQSQKAGEPPVWDAIMGRRELQAELDAQQPKVAAPLPISFKQDGTPVYKTRKLRRA